MIGCSPLSSFGNLACRLRKEDCASASLFCDDSCTMKPSDVLSVASGAARVATGGAAAVRVRLAGAAAGSLCGSSEIGPVLRAGAAFGAAGGGGGRVGGGWGWGRAGRGIGSGGSLAAHRLAARVTAIRADRHSADFLRLVRCAWRGGALCRCDRRRQNDARRRLVCEILQRDRLLLFRNDLFLVSPRPAILCRLARLFGRRNHLRRA